MAQPENDWGFVRCRKQYNQLPPKKIFSDNELEENSVTRNFRITAKDGKNYNTKHYNLSAIIGVGYKVNSERAVQFRKWATVTVKEYTIKAYVMDDERIKHDGSILGKQYFEEQLTHRPQAPLVSLRYLCWLSCSTRFTSGSCIDSVPMKSLPVHGL